MIECSSASRFSTGVPVSASAVTGAQGTDRARLLGLARLDVLRLVEHHPLPLELRERVTVAQRQRVGRDHQVAARGRVQERLPLEPLAPVVDMYVEAWCESLPPRAASSRRPRRDR